MPVSNVKTPLSSKLDVDRQTDRQTDYCNIRACTLRVNNSQKTDKCMTAIPTSCASLYFYDIFSIQLEYDTFMPLTFFNLFSY